MIEADIDAFAEWCKENYTGVYCEQDIWEACCAYKDKRIKELEEEDQVKLTIIMDQAREIEDLLNQI